MLLVVLSASAEILQLLIVLLTRNTARIIDITDLILNLGGSLFAWYVFGIFKESHKRKKELRKKLKNNEMISTKQDKTIHPCYVAFTEP